ncbi:trichohyalin isoform X3 [Archocentrus centrarchus]|uniref:trichohyalin isoform X3 n=1 Tax=Archocentrus centrarchus TaxID=63155 RepID=UPI0011EA1230|nr:trichohyalin-like isoform X3 [Archocentrus centrarchus]
MAGTVNGGGDRDAADPEKLLYTDLIDNRSVYGFDHCDRLLDALDAQLGQLQVLPQKCELDCNSAVLLGWNQSLSKDTGLGSTTEQNDTPMSCLNVIHTSTVEQTYENTEGCWKDPVSDEESEKRFDRRRRDKQEIESCREQVIWRLERLLGDTCRDGQLAEETHPPSDSICTEDFVTRFREEMVELTLPDSCVQMLDREEESEGTNISDSNICQSKHEQNVSNIQRRESETTGESSDDTLTAQHSQSNQPGQKKKNCVSHRTNGANILQASEKAGAGERYKSPQRLGDDSSVSRRTEVLTDLENVNNSCSPKARCLAGVPVLSFDAVSIDSDLDTVCTEQVRQHMHKWPGWRTLIQSVMDMNDQCSNQTDCDTTTQEESEPQSGSIQRSSYGHVCSRSPSVRNTQRNRRATYRTVSHLSDTDEEINSWSRKSRPERTLETMQSEWVKMKGRLSNLRKKCEKEEETLRLKKAQAKDVERCLSELRQKRKHALQELERLAVETAQMEEEKRTMESVQRDSKAERKSVGGGPLQKMRQKESCLLQGRDAQEDFATQDESCLKPQNSVKMSVMEREELERQLDGAKTQLFAEQRCAREKLESMQEKLEETYEELQRASEAEVSLRNRCACLEEKQMQKTGQIEALEVQVSGLQGELGEHKIRVGTMEKMLARKELQLLDLQEQCGALQAERDGLKVEQQHLKMQHHKALKEVEEQAHRIMLKEEEVIKLKKSLQQQKEEVKKREEELHVEALEKLHKAVEEERRKWEAEKMGALQVHCGILEEQNKKVLENLRSEMQADKSKALALQHQVMQLKTKIQELEREHCAQQRDQESLLAAICKSLKEEHQAELQRSRRQMAENQRTALRLEKDVQLAVKEADRLRVMLEQRESSHNQITAEMEQQLRHWTQQLAAECQHLHLLVEQSGAKQSPGKLPPSVTVAEALTNLKTLREQLKDFISYLHQELDSQKQTNKQLRKEKERELSIQRQQLRLERDQVLNSVKERLIQEHIEELSSLKWVHMSDGGGVAACLRKQLKAKDSELRQVQRSMAEWKGQTAARLARKFEEELTAELERKAPRAQEERQRKPEGPEEEMILGATAPQKSFNSPYLQAVSSPCSPSDMASFKLIRHLQNKVKQLRAENQAYTQSSPPPDLSGSYLGIIPQGQDTAGSLSNTKPLSV